MSNRLDLRPLPATHPEDELDHQLVALHPPDLALPDFLLAGELVNVRREDAIANLIFGRRGWVETRRGEARRGEAIASEPCSEISLRTAPLSI